MTDDATQQTDEPGPGHCEIHGWESGDFFGTVLIPARDCRVFGTLRICTDCIDRMSAVQRHHFLSFIGVSVTNFARAPADTVEVDVATDRSDPTAWCALHHLTAGQIRDHVVEVPRDKEVSICGSCMGRINGAMRIRVSAESPGRIRIDASDLNLTPKETP